MDVWTKFEEGRSRVLELLMGNNKVTNGQTDKQTDMCKAICPPFFEEGHYKFSIIIVKYP